MGSPKIGEIPLPYHSRRTGDHTPHGFFLVRGPGIQPGKREGSVSVSDVSATLAALVGITIPDGDGLPIAGD